MLLVRGADHKLVNSLGLTAPQEMKGKEKILQRHMQKKQNSEFFFIVFPGEAMVAWKIFREHGVEGLVGRWEEVQFLVKRDIIDKKLERTERVTSQRPSLEDIPRPIRPRDLGGMRMIDLLN